MVLQTLGSGFAAEGGVGFEQGAARDDAYRAVREAFETHSVLLFRGQRVSDELQVAFSRRFGPLETAKAASPGAEVSNAGMQTHRHAFGATSAWRVLAGHALFVLERPRAGRPL